MLSQVGSASSQTYKKKISLTSHLPGDLDMPTPLVWVHLQPSEKKKTHTPSKKYPGSKLLNKENNSWNILVIMISKA